MRSVVVCWLINRRTPRPATRPGQEINKPGQGLERAASACTHIMWHMVPDDCNRFQVSHEAGRALACQFKRISQKPNEINTMHLRVSVPWTCHSATVQEQSMHRNLTGRHKPSSNHQSGLPFWESIILFSSVNLLPYFSHISLRICCSRIVSLLQYYLNYVVCCHCCYACKYYLYYFSQRPSWRSNGSYLCQRKWGDKLAISHSLQVKRIPDTTGECTFKGNTEEQTAVTACKKGGLWPQSRLRHRTW